MMKLLDKVKISSNWMVQLPKEVRKELNASKGDFLNYIKKDNGEVILKLSSMKQEMEAFKK